MTSERPLALTGGCVFTGLDKTPLDGASVVIDGEAIAVVAGAEEPVGDAHVLDVAGCTVLPGLIDCHTHLFYGGLRSLEAITQCPPAIARRNAVANARRTLAAGFTTVRELGTIGNLSAELRDEIEAGALYGPRIVAAGRIITSVDGPLPGHRVGVTAPDGFAVLARGPRELAAAAREQLRDGVDVVKLMASGLELHPTIGPDVTVLSEAEIRAAVDVAHEAGATVAVHSQSLESAKRALRAGADTIEHGTALDAECCELFLRSGAVLVPTLSTPESVRELGGELGLAAHQRAQTDAAWACWRESLALAAEAGVPVAAGGDIGNRYPAGTNAREITLLAREGLPPAEALRAATSVAARAIGRPADRGALAPGHLADVVVVDGDVLENLAALLDPGRIRLVLQGGRAVAGDVTALEREVSGWKL